MEIFYFGSLLMQEFHEGSRCNPHDFTLHKQIKDISDLLRPELLRLYKCPEEVGGNDHLYAAFIEGIRSVEKEISNCDALFAFHNIINHMKKIQELSEKKSKNQELLSHLQEVMALLFKVQNMPS